MQIDHEHEHSDDAPQAMSFNPPDSPFLRLVALCASAESLRDNCKVQSPSLRQVLSDSASVQLAMRLGDVPELVREFVPDGSARLFFERGILALCETIQAQASTIAELEQLLGDQQQIA